MTFSINPLGKPTPATPEDPKIFSETYRHSIVDSTYQPERSLLSEVRGMPRLAQYWRQFFNGSEEPKPFSPGGLPTYQQYTRIDKVPLKLEGDGSFDFDPQTGESKKTYSAWIIFDVSPIVHDIFIMDIGDGNAGLFAITTQPEIRNFTANKVYQIQFSLLYILTKALFTNLEQREVEHKIYSKDSALHGGHSLITGLQEETGKKLFSWEETISNYIMRTHYWSPELTIAYGKEDEKIYDPYLVNFLNAVIKPDMRTTYPPINQFSLQYGGLTKARWGTMNVWEFLLRSDMNVLKICDNKAMMIDTNRLEPTRLYGNLWSSRFRWFVSTNPEDFKQYKAYVTIDGYPVVKPSPEVPIGHYLFSEGFYHGAPQGEFENIVYSSYRDQQIDHERLLKYCDGYFDLSPMERLYHGAILLRLLAFAHVIRGPL